jgi:hypothetical protein
MNTQLEVEPKAVVFTALNNLHSEVCAVFDSTTSYPEGKLLRLTLHPDGDVSIESAARPSTAPEGSITIKFAVERTPEYAADNYEDIEHLTEEARQWELAHGAEVDRWIAGLVARN